MSHAMAAANPSLRSLLSPMLTNLATAKWLFQSTHGLLPPTNFAISIPVSIHQETLSARATPLANGTNVEQLIIPSHCDQHETIVYGYVYATGVKYAEADRGKRRPQSSSHALKARFCYDSTTKEYVMVQIGSRRKGVMSFRRTDQGFRKCFFIVEGDGDTVDGDGGVGRCLSARCVVGETDQYSPVTPASLASINAYMQDLRATIKGSFFSLSSTEDLLCGSQLTKRELGRELIIVGDVDKMMVQELRDFAASMHYEDGLSPRVEEPLDIGLRRRLAAWRCLQRRRLRNIGERWELKALKELKLVLEGRYKVVKEESEMLKQLWQTQKNTDD